MVRSCPKMAPSRNRRRRLLLRSRAPFLILTIAAIGVAAAFVTPTSVQIDLSHRGGREAANPQQRRFESTLNRLTDSQCRTQRKQQTELFFMGSDGGILGIGTPEVFTILLVGYFVLGPSDLYKLTKEIGKFVQNFRTFTTEATASLENNFESQLQLEEIRKAQRELNDAFSFRRSINVEEDTDPFEVNAKSARLDDPFYERDQGDAAGTLTTATGPAKKKRVRRVKKAKELVPTEDEDYDFEGLDTANKGQLPLTENVPDLDAFDNGEGDDDEEMSLAERRAMDSMNEAREQLKKERMERLQSGSTSSSSSPKGAPHDESTAMEVMEKSRFQQQLAGDWNGKILEKGDKLDPLASIMDRLALLEDEKLAADKRLQEEFKLRETNEERYYREKRKLLEDAAAQVQAVAYAPTVGPSESAKK